jgi:hypothetical protein
VPNPVTVDIDLYCTHAELADEVGGARKLAKLVPPDADATDPTLLVRQQSLRDVLKSLKRRTPPIIESQIGTKSELKDAVAYGALMRLYRAAMTIDTDVHAVLWKEYKNKFSAEINSLRITVEGSNTVDVPATTVFRR